MAPKCSWTECRREAWRDSRQCLPHLLGHLADAPSPVTRETIASVLECLTLKEREVIQLHTGVGDGYTYANEEIARIFKLTRSQINGVLHRAIIKLGQPAVQDRLKSALEVIGLDKPSPSLSQAIEICSQGLLDYVARHPSTLLDLPSRNFEEIVAEVLHALGFSVDLTQRTRDGGRDIIACTQDILGIATKYIVECKRYTPENRVGVAPVRALYGVKQADGADHAILATTSSFTNGAWRFAAQPHVLNLHLRDFEAIQEWFKAYHERWQWDSKEVRARRGKT